MCGCQFTIEHFDEPLTIEIKDIIKPNSMFQVFQKGMPIKKDDIKSLTDSNDSEEKDYGTLIIDLQIIYPYQNPTRTCRDMRSGKEKKHNSMTVNW